MFQYIHRCKKFTVKFIAYELGDELGVFENWYSINILAHGLLSASFKHISNWHLN